MNSSELEFGIYRYEMQKGVVVIVPYISFGIEIYMYTTRVRLLCVKYNSQRIKQFATILDGVPNCICACTLYVRCGFDLVRARAVEVGYRGCSDRGTRLSILWFPVA